MVRFRRIPAPTRMEDFLFKMPIPKVIVLSILAAAPYFPALDAPPLDIRGTRSVESGSELTTLLLSGMVASNLAMNWSACSGNAVIAFKVLRCLEMYSTPPLLYTLVWGRGGNVYLKEQSHVEDERSIDKAYRQGPVLRLN